MDILVKASSTIVQKPFQNLIEMQIISHYVLNHVDGRLITNYEIYLFLSMYRIFAINNEIPLKGFSALHKIV